MRTATSLRNETSVDEENPYWMSFSDIMAGLLVIFILAAVALILELDQKSKRWDEEIDKFAEAEKVRKDVLNDIQRELYARGIKVIISENDTVIRIPEDVFKFEPTKFNIPSDPVKQNIAMQIGEVLYAAIKKGDRWKYLDTIFVEGHTDNRPYNNEAIKGNWGLSTFRAISVWNFWNSSADGGEKLEALENHQGNKLFSVSGYADTRPVPKTAEDMDDEIAYNSKNRRIDIRFTIRRPEMKDYDKTKAGLR